MRRLLALAALTACHPEDPGPGRRPDPDRPPAAARAAGRPLQRLNGPEFDRAIRDLFGIDRPFSPSFPPDEIAFGFDNQASALTTSAALFEAWEAAAGVVADELAEEKSEVAADLAAEGEGAGVLVTGTGRPTRDAYLLAEGTLTVPFTVDADGAFVLTVKAGGEALSGPPILDVTLDGAFAASFTVAEREPADLVVPLELDEGLHAVVLTIRNPYAVGPDARAIGVDRVALRGPLEPEVGRSAVWRRIVPCAPDGAPDAACRRSALRALGERAWRRPLTDPDLDWILAVEAGARAAGAPPEEAVGFAVRAILLAPEFLYRVEPPPPAGADTRALEGPEVATRMAAFLWSSVPDDALREAAAAGALGTPEGRAAQVARMLADPRADALVDDLAGQWFDVRAVDRVTPDPLAFPHFDEALRRATRAELADLAAGFFREGRPLRELVSRETSRVDARLAAHYRVGYDEASGGWQEAYADRPGVLGTAAFLMVHARPAKASAVSRGKWILENLLCSPTPPPPPTVDMALALVPEGGSVREQEEAARGAGACQGCHGILDPYGFALNAYDAVGAERAVDELGYPVDDAVAIGGASVVGGVELAELLAADPRLDRCAVEKTLTWALGRPLTEGDDDAVEAAAEAFVAGGSTFPALAAAVVESRPFLARDAAPEVP